MKELYYSHQARTHFDFYILYKVLLLAERQHSSIRGQQGYTILTCSTQWLLIVL